MKKYSLFLSVVGILLFVAGFGKAQTNFSKEDMGKVFEKTNSWFRLTPSYQLNVTHASYENYITQVPFEKSTGYFKKQGSNYHSLLLGIHTIQNNTYKIVIDTVEKIIAVANPDQLTWISYTQEDYKVLLKSATATRTSKTGRYSFYRVELPEQNPIGAYEFLLDETERIREISWYYNREVKKDPNDNTSAVKPRMGISFSGYKENPSFSYAETFSEAPYFKNENNKLVLTEKYATYKLLDQRIKR